MSFVRSVVLLRLSGMPRKAEYKPLPSKQCAYCSQEYPAKRRSRTCGAEECVVRDVTHQALTNVKRIGDCELWQGFFRKKGHVPMICADLYDADGTKRRKEYRAMVFRWPNPEETAGRLFKNRCGNPDCVTVEHTELQKKTVVNNHGHIKAKLPAQPLLDYIRRLEEREPDLVLGTGRERIHRYERDGQLSVTSADSFCIDVLGVHPTAVFGELFFEV